MMDATTALDRLTDLCPHTEEPTLTDQQIDRCLAFAATVDAAGRSPDDPEWEPTYSTRGIYLAAREAWTIKKARAANRFDFATDGQMFRRSQVADHCDEMIRRMNSKLAASARSTAD